MICDQLRFVARHAGVTVPQLGFARTKPRTA